MLKWFLTGGALPWLLGGCGVFLIFYLKGAPLKNPRWMLRAMTAPAPSGGTSPFRAVMLALAGTLGVGNIVGVANAIAVGGAGAVFWMWLSALVAMILKYAEILLAVSHRREGKHGFFGGAYYYIKDHFLSKGWVRTASVLSGLFAALMIVDALTMGCVIQVNAISRAWSGVTSLPAWVGGVLILLLALPVIIKGSRGISSLTELLVPIMSAGYAILSVAVLIACHKRVGAAFGSILREAFSPASMGGGVLGFLTSSALRTGTMRGLLSNEAGCGTAPTAHAAADAHSPAAQGVWGIFEVFVDTILLCTATALVILVSLPQVEMLGHDPVMMTIRAYSSVLGGWSEWFFCAAVFCFGYATVLCWANYGMESVAFLSRGRLWRYLYIAAVGACIVMGSMVAPDSVWDVADFAIAALTAINLLVLIRMRREIRAETELGIKS
jgi:AGCS family alanine or glycine:cation symporter